MATGQRHPKYPPAVIQAPGARGSTYTVLRLRIGTRVPMYAPYATCKSEQVALDIYEKCLAGEVLQR